MAVRFLIAFLLISISAFSQTDDPVKYSKNPVSYGFQYNRMKADSNFHFPIHTDTLSCETIQDQSPQLYWYNDTLFVFSDCKNYRIALKSEIPVNNINLINGAQYVNASALSPYLKIVDTTNKWQSKGDYASISQIPTNNNQLTNGANYLTELAASSTYLTQLIAAATYQPKGSYALASQIPTNNNQLANGSNFITSSSLSPYVKIVDTSNKWQGKGSYVDLNSTQTVSNKFLNKSFIGFLSVPSEKGMITSGDRNGLMNAWYKGSVSIKIFGNGTVPSNTSTVNSMFDGFGSYLQINDIDSQSVVVITVTLPASIPPNGSAYFHPFVLWRMSSTARFSNIKVECTEDSLAYGWLSPPEWDSKNYDESLGLVSGLWMGKQQLTPAGSSPKIVKFTFTGAIPSSGRIWISELGMRNVGGEFLPQYLKASGDDMLGDFNVYGKLIAKNTNVEVTGGLKASGTLYGKTASIQFDPSNYISITPNSTGSTTFDLAGTNPEFTFAKKMNTSSDVEITDKTKGIILKSPNGSRFKITVSDAGVLTATPL